MTLTNRDNSNPYSPSFKDPYDSPIDAVGRNIHPLPRRNGDGASIMGPRNKAREQQEPDIVRPPATDHGTMKNFKWSFADSHMRIEEGGWTRQTTVRELPTSTQLAGVNMRLDEGAIRELHWHKEAEWAYVLEGKVRVTALDTEGGNFMVSPAFITATAVRVCFNLASGLHTTVGTLCGGMTTY